MTHTPNPRRTLALAFAVALVAIAGPRHLAAQTLKHGDVNGDGVVSALDAQAILTSVVSLPLPQGYVVANGDANCDNTTSALDAQIVLSHVIGLNVSQYCVAQAFGPGAIKVTLTPTDTSLLVNKGLRFRAILQDSAGNGPLARPIAWATSNADLVTIDSTRGDTAWVSNHGAAVDATATITATADGVSKSTTVRVFRSYAGIVITPQKPDTMRQLNALTQFTARTRDSTGAFVGYPTALWTVADTNIATVPSAAANAPYVTAKTTGTTVLRAVNSANPADSVSVPIVVALPAISSCTGTGGTLHESVTYSGAQTWAAATNPHYLSGTVYFDSTASLTIEPGVLVCTASGASMYFRPGSHMTALGTVAAPIVFRPTNPSWYWYGIQLGDALSYTTGALKDTSRFRNVVFERPYDAAVDGREQHVVLMDSVKILQAQYGALTLMGPGSRMTRSLIDTLTYSYAGYFAVTLGRGALEQTTIRPGPLSGGVNLTENAMMLQDSIIGGTTAIAQDYYNTGARLNDIAIVNPDSVALALGYAKLDSASANVTVTGGKSGVFQGLIENLAILFPDSLAQEKLLGNGRDTIFVEGGSLARDTVVARADLPWIVTSWVYVDTLAHLKLLPGSKLRFTYGGLDFRYGGTLSAVGTSSARILLAPYGSSSSFYGLRFDSPGAGGNPALAPTATSTLTFVRVDSAYGQGNDGVGYTSAISGGMRHRLLLDSVFVHKAYYSAVALSAKGSYLKGSTIDTTGGASTNYVNGYPAVVLGDSILVESSLVRRSGQNGIYAYGQGVDLRNVDVIGSVGTALSLEGGVLAATTTNVRAINGNARPFYGKIENLAIVARDSLSQATKFAGNADSVIAVYGGTLTKDTVVTIPGFRWEVDNWLYVDTLAQLKPYPGARITFNSYGITFRKGGTLNAVGTPTAFIQFLPVAANTYFYGLRFDSPGGNGNPAQDPTAISTLTYVRIDSAYGQGNDGVGYTAAISGGVRHRLLMDSVIVHKAWYSAVALSARGSYLKRSIVDTTGVLSSNYTNSTPAVVLGDSVLVENSIIRRSGQDGIYVVGSLVELKNLDVVASQRRGLSLDYGILKSTSTNVRAIGGNATPFYGKLENLAIVARDSLGQATRFGGNVDSLIEITGGTLKSDTVAAIKGFRWRVQGYTYIDTLARFNPYPGADIRFTCCGMQFQHGGTLYAVGASGNRIRFRPEGASFWYGLRFDNPGSGGGAVSTYPKATSTLTFVQLDSAYGQSADATIAGNGAINASDRHKLFMDSTIVHKAFYTAVVLSAPGSYMKRGIIDTTGLVASNYTTSGNYAALMLNDSTNADSTLVRRSGNTGIYTEGRAISMYGAYVFKSQNYGIHVGWNTPNSVMQGSTGLKLVGFKVDSALVAGVYVEADSANFEQCEVLRGVSNGFVTTPTITALNNASRKGVRIRTCNIEDNAGYAVFNGDSLFYSAAASPNLIIAGDSTSNQNFWGVNGVSTDPTYPNPAPNRNTRNVTATFRASIRYNW